MNVEEFEEGKKAFLELESIYKAQQAQIANIIKRVKKLEQKDSYYPTKEEIPHIKVGGTD